MSQFWKQIQILQSKQNIPVFYFLCQNYCCQWHSSNSFLPERHNNIFKLAHAGPKLPCDDKAGKPFVPAETPNPDLLWHEASYGSKVGSRKSLGGEKIFTSGPDLSLSTRWAPRCSSKSHFHRQIHSQISRNYLRDGCQKHPIISPLSNGRSWPLIPPSSGKVTLSSWVVLSFSLKQKCQFWSFESLRMDSSLYLGRRSLPSVTAALIHFLF